jgi:hypothetical protein
MSNAQFFCEVCNKTMLLSSKSRHLKTKIHEKNSSGTQKNQVPNIKSKEVKKECLICCEKQIKFNTCSTCNQFWCLDCDKNIAECPYCRASLQREDRLQLQRRNNTEWQLDQPAFVYNNHQNISSILFDILLLELILSN